MAAPFLLRLRGTRAFAVLLAIAALGAAVGCGETAPTEPDVEPPPPAITCATTPKMVLAGTVSGTLAAAESPVRLDGETVQASTLTIEAGVLVCASPGTVLRIDDTLRVTGTADDPVRFLPVDSVAPWGGIQGVVVRSSGSTIQKTSVLLMNHVEVAHAADGIIGGEMVLEGVLVRSTGGAGVEGYGAMKDITVVDACGEGSFCAAITAGGAGRGTPKQTTLDGALIVGSGSDGFRGSVSSIVTLSNVRIEDPAASAIVVGQAVAAYRAGELTLAGPLSAHGQGGYLLDAPGGVAGPFMSAYSDSLRRGDRIRSVGRVAVPVIIPAGVSWIAEMDQLSRPPFFDRVTLGAGSEFRARYAGFRELEAVGTPDDPARLAVGIAFIADVAVLTDVAVDGGTFHIDAPDAKLNRVTAQGATLRFKGAGSVVENTVVVLSSGDGIEIAANDVVLRRCDVESNGGRGILVTEGSGVRVEDSNLTQNGGAGITNQGADPIQATGNWWGDPAGPLGPEGDGVEGDVSHETVLTAPAGSPAVSVLLKASLSAVHVGDTVRIHVLARDASSNPVPPTHFTLGQDGDLLAFPFSTDPFLALAEGTGTARLEAVYLQDSSVRGVVSVLVSEATAHGLEW